MSRESLPDLIWNMECKGFDSSAIHFYLDTIWLLFSYIPQIHSRSSYERKLYEERLAQAHIEIDFTGYQKKLHGQFS